MVTKPAEWEMRTALSRRLGSSVVVISRFEAVLPEVCSNAPDLEQVAGDSLPVMSSKKILCSSKAEALLWATVPGGLRANRKLALRRPSRNVWVANEIASQVGIEILHQGDNTVDAAVADAFAVVHTEAGAKPFGHRAKLCFNGVANAT